MFWDAVARARVGVRLRLWIRVRVQTSLQSVAKATDLPRSTLFWWTAARLAATVRVRSILVGATVGVGVGFRCTFCISSATLRVGPLVSVCMG